MRTHRQQTRRRFLRTAALGTAALACPNFISARDVNSKLNIAVIGCGGRGAANMRAIKGENFVALCDVNESNVLKAAESSPKAKHFRDFRVMYDTLKDSEFDAVIVSSTEHTHAVATLPALRRKKHVYCEKPLTHNIYEARIVREAAAKAGVATQMGTQNHATDNYRRVVELVKSGIIGPIREAHVWVSRAWGWQSEEDAQKNKDIVSIRDRPREEMPIPKDLDWDLWLGPAPFRPFHSVYVPGPKWYRWWDFGSGTMSDLGAHWMDLPFWALDLDFPQAVSASGPPPHPELAPASMSATFEYGARENRPPVRVSWYQGVMKPEIWTEGKIPQWPDGALFIGDKGMLLSNYRKHILLPEKDFADVPRPPKSIPDSRGHHAEWIHACKTSEPTLSNFAYAGLLTEANHLGSIAYRLGKRIEWDTKKLEVVNAPEAARLVRREYRKGWEL